MPWTPGSVQEGWVDREARFRYQRGNQVTCTKEAGVKRAEGTVCCGVLACAGLTVPSPALADWRSRLARPTLPLGQLRQADEQTVVGLAAVTQALAQLGEEPVRHSAWGVLGAPELLGRTVMAQTLACFAQEGAWGMSPHLIPHRSLHALSGTISQALGLHGPNCGVGGGPGAAAEGLLAAATLLEDATVPGLWLVCTRGLSASENDWLWQAVALALAADARRALLCLEICPAPGRGSARESPPEADKGVVSDNCAAVPSVLPEHTPLFGLETLLELAAAAEDLQPACWRLPSGGWLRWQPARAVGLQRFPGN
jgi:hypothetical protein